jgi:exopolysaccharide biosynthesis polyprenyl glycosylphosphotransferase
MLPDQGATSQPAAGAPPSGADDIPLLRRLNRHGFRLVMLLDVAALSLITLGSMFIRFGTAWPDAPIGNYLLSFAMAIGVFIASLYFGGLYEREPRLGAPPVLPRAGQQALAAGGLTALISLGLSGLARELGIGPQRALPFPITNLVVLIVLGAIAVAINRKLVNLARTQREGPPRVVLVGEPAEVETALDHLASDRARARVVGVHSSGDDLLAVVERSDATDLVLLSPRWLELLYGDTLRALDKHGTAVMLRVTGRETLLGLERIREIGGMPFVRLRVQTLPRSRARFKRLVDLVLLVIGGPIWLPLLGVVALYQWVVAGRPLLYWQDRVGQGGRTFRMVKFRTMTVDAEADGGGARLAASDDPRVIPACKWIRSTRMDELPQLWNVWRGEMSLVGPRPERPELTSGFERRIEGYDRRHEVPPGLTGLAQIHGRYHTDPEYKLGYDLQYLVNWSPLLDVQIIFRTVWVVVARRI